MEWLSNKFHYLDLFVDLFSLSLTYSSISWTCVSSRIIIAVTAIRQMGLECRTRGRTIANSDTAWNIIDEFYMFLPFISFHFCVYVCVFGRSISGRFAIWFSSEAQGCSTRDKLMMMNTASLFFYLDFSFDDGDDGRTRHLSGPLITEPCITRSN